MVSNFHHGPASFYPHFGFLFRSVVFLLPKEKRKNTAKETKACADRTWRPNIYSAPLGLGELEGKLVMLDVAEPKVEKDRHAIPK